MKNEILEVLHPGLGITVQAGPRLGWKRFGVPPGGPMDLHAAGWANRLLDNAPDAPLLELLLQGGRLRILQDTWLAVTGADSAPRLIRPESAIAPHAPSGAAVPFPLWHAAPVARGSVLEFPANRIGVWTYVAVASGLEAATYLGSASVYPRGSMGSTSRAGD